MTSPRIALFALTGFGNTVLPALCATGLKPELLVTRAEAGPYPYYEEEPLTAVAERLGVPYLFGAEGEENVAANPPDIVLCATYHRLLRAPILRGVRWPINLHPSLLPRYRGPNPFYWVIRNREKQTGVTAHLMTDAADAGPILRREAIDISATETQGSLRHRLAALAAKVAVHTVRDLQSGTATPTPQNEADKTAFDRPGTADRTLDDTWGVDEVESAARALSPFPGLITDAGIVTELVGPAGSAERPESLEMGLYRLRLRDGDLIVRLRA
jgi:methionyl-tRNA formyltransferase